MKKALKKGQNFTDPFFQLDACTKKKKKNRKA